MNWPRQPRSLRGFTLIELLVVLGIISLLAALLLPGLARGKVQARRAVCRNQLQQIGLGFHMFAHDHDGKFPMRVKPEEGGTMVANAPEAADLFAPAFEHFRALAGELTTPRLLVCPMDGRAAAENFAELRNERVSYFVGVTAELGGPNLLLAGDRNLARNRTEDARTLRWTKELHQRKGNVLFADGHVEGANQPALAGLASEADNLILPDPGDPGPSAGLFPRRRTARRPAATSSPPHPDPAAGLDLPLARFAFVSHLARELAAQSNASAPAGPRPAATEASEEDSEPASFDAAVLGFFRKVITGGYALIMLLFLVLLALALWREWRQRRQLSPPKPVLAEEI